MREAINTKICTTTKKRVLETITIVVVQNGVHCGATLVALERTGKDVNQRLKRHMENGLNHSMLQVVPLQRKCTMLTTTEDVRPKQERVILAKIGALTSLIIEEVSTRITLTKERKVSVTTTTAEVVDGVLYGATLMIQRRTGIGVIL